MYVGVEFTTKRNGAKDLFNSIYIGGTYLTYHESVSNKWLCCEDGLFVSLLFMSSAECSNPDLYIGNNGNVGLDK